MTFRIGFSADRAGGKPEKMASGAGREPMAPKRSVVQVYFAGRNMTLAYYNDRFDLKRGDLVYVDGKLEGLLGRVVGVNYNFKIRLADYKRVIARVDTAVSGRFHLADTHFVTFDREALPFSQAVSWFRAPEKEGEEYACGSDDTAFCLSDLDGMGVSAAIAERGHDYYISNRVRYLSLDGCQGRAIVEGGEAYEVEFEYHNGEIRSLTCSCFCSYNCKHEYAVMLQLRHMLELIEARYAGAYERTGYFAAVAKEAMFDFALAGRENGEFTLE